MRPGLAVSAALIALPFALLPLAAVPAAAETRPKSVGADARIKQFVYVKDTVYRLDVAMKFITSIEFAPGESIDSVLMGDSESWEVIRLQSGNVLAVKPLIEGARTNMTVYTSQNSYTFELRAVRVAAGSASLSYRIGFIYPGRDKAKAERQRVDQSRPRDPNYYAAGRRAAFRPVSVFDDGRRTWFEFGKDAPRPAIFRVDETGREAIVNVQQTDTGSVVVGTSDRWTLRIGDEEICIAHGRVIRSVPGGRKAASLRAGYVEGRTPSPLPASARSGSGTSR